MNEPCSHFSILPVLTADFWSRLAKRLASDFNVVIYPVSVIGERNPPTVWHHCCEKDAQKRVLPAGTDIFRR